MIPVMLGSYCAEQAEALGIDSLAQQVADAIVAGDVAGWWEGFRVELEDGLSAIVRAAGDRLVVLELVRIPAPSVEAVRGARRRLRRRAAVAAQSVAA